MKKVLPEVLPKKYNVKMLVYYEYFDDIYEATHREIIIKKWKRSIKMNVIERTWEDLCYDLI